MLFPSHWRCLAGSLPLSGCPVRNTTMPILHTCTSNPRTHPFSTTPAPNKEFKHTKKLHPKRVLTPFELEAKKNRKRPAVGERKAMRTRVVLSNGNALEVPGMRDLDAARCCDEKLVGTMLGLNGDMVDILRAAGGFKASQAWRLFRRPGLLVRQEGVELIRKIVGWGEKNKEQDNLITAGTGVDEGREMNDGEVEGKGEFVGKGVATQKRTPVNRVIVDGAKECGKSAMLLWAMAFGLCKEWVVVHIPEGREIVNASTEYHPLKGTNPLSYAQPIYISQLLNRVIKTNSTILARFQVALQHNLPTGHLQSNMSLLRLCELGAREPEVAWPFYQAFMSEMQVPGRPPLLYTLDGLNFLTRESVYRSPEYEKVHGIDLAIVRHFVDFLIGTKELPNGGAVIAATSRSQALNGRSLELWITRDLQRQQGVEENALKQRDPWCGDYDKRVEELLAVGEANGLHVLGLKGLSRLEARGYMEHWARSGLYKRRIDEGVVGAAWTLAGHGVVGHMERTGLEMGVS